MLTTNWPVSIVEGAAGGAFLARLENFPVYSRRVLANDFYVEYIRLTFR
jgi:hypothetical protein